MLVGSKWSCDELSLPFAGGRWAQIRVLERWRSPVSHLDFKTFDPLCLRIIRHGRSTQDASLFIPLESQQVRDINCCINSWIPTTSAAACFPPCILARWYLHRACDASGHEKRRSENSILLSSQVETSHGRWAGRQAVAIPLTAKGAFQFIAAHDSGWHRAQQVSLPSHPTSHCSCPRSTGRSDPRRSG